MIEDDLELAQIISDYLKSFDIEVTNTDSPYNGLSMLSVHKDYQLIILDLTLPEIDGLELIPKIREKSDIPIIISSARDDILDKVMGLERGADDYLPKPYNPRELQARIKTILKRVDHPTNEPKNATNNSRNSVRNFELVNRILDCIAPIAFCLPNIISGVLKTVNIPMPNEIIPPTTGTLKWVKALSIPELINVIIKVATNNSLK